jgi:micrococcal nuclease
MGRDRTRRLTFLLVVGLLGAPALARAQHVTKVPSGDTIVVDGVGKVRLVGITSLDERAMSVGDAPTPAPRHDPPSPTSKPPTVFNGGIKFDRNRPSRDFLRQIALGKTITLQYDTLVENASPRFAYVFLPDGTMLNAEMLRRGKAKVDTSRSFAHQDEFLRLEQQARDAGLGVWARTP